MKKSARFLFETDLQWTTDKNGILSSRVINDKIRVSAPKLNTEKEKGNWSPEHLLISAVNAGFMTSFMFFAKQKHLDITAFSCEVIGHVEFRNERLKLTEINVYPKVAVENQASIKKAGEVIEITKQHCLVARALNVIIYYHPVVESGIQINRINEMQNSLFNT